MAVGTIFVYICNMPPDEPNDYQPRFPGIDVHYFDNIELGGEQQFNWLQKCVTGPYWRVYWNETPGAYVRVKNLEVALKPDHVIVLSPNTTYSTRLTRQVKHFYVHFSTGRPYSQVTPRLIQLRSPQLIDQARHMAAQTQRSHDDYRTHIHLQQYICQIMLDIPSRWVPALTEYDPRVSAVMTILKEKIGLSNPELAKHVNMSTNGFLHLFKEQTGVSPQRHARRQRLEQAAIMLHYSHNSIEAIAEKTGFTDRYHLSKCFKNEFGMGPSAFRKTR
jgi:AraC-like DNA-binding protein